MLRQTGHHPIDGVVHETDAALTEQQDTEPNGPYSGPPGRTRTEQVRVFRPGRDPLEVEVFRVLNVFEHPELREPALRGALHRLDDGELVEVPFVFHDPVAQQFALVIPEGARNRELSERARLLDRLMSEHEADVPDYVRHFAILYGHRGLRRYVDDAEAMEVDASELEPVDAPTSVASCYPRLAGRLPPAGFAERSRTELAPLIDDDSLWLFASLENEEANAFTESSTDLLVQLKTVEQLPVCILALVDSRQGAVRRAYLNPVRSSEGPILELLRRDFRATVIVLDGERRLVRSFRIEAPRAANARMILERADRAPSASKESWARAADVCRAMPPPADPVEHPFVIQTDAANAAEALRRLRHLERWSAPDRVEEALLLRSVPRTVFELSRRRIVVDALAFGLAMSDALVLQAVRFGFGPNSRSVIASLRQRFAEIVPAASEHGLNEAEVQANVAALGRLEALHGTSTGPGVSCTMEYSG